MQLRIGIHSGPVIVGVHYVGHKIPRYRLYGETVQVSLFYHDHTQKLDHFNNHMKLSSFEEQ